MDYRLLRNSIFCCLLLLSCTAKAQNAESASRAEAIVADSGLWVSMVNPAAANYTQKISIGVGYRNYYFIPQLHSTAAIANIRLWRGVVIGAVSAQSGYPAWSKQTFCIGYSLHLHQTLLVGAAIDLQHTTLTGIPSTIALFPMIGVRYSPITKLTIGLSIQNATYHNTEQHPTVMRCAIQSTQIENSTLSLQCDKDNAHPVVLRLGCRYALCLHFGIRAGIASNMLPLSYGIDFTFKNWQCCIAAQQHVQLGTCPSIQTTYNF